MTLDRPVHASEAADGTTAQRGRGRPYDPGGRHRKHGHDLHRRDGQRGGGGVRLPGQGAARQRGEPLVELRTH